jgi:predicted dienelactone hydrolase
LTQVWYPAADTGGAAAHRYGGLVQGEALDRPPAACDGPRPVAVFSHGNQGLRWQSFPIAEALAARGFVVAAPDHTGNTLYDGAPAGIPLAAVRRPYDIQSAYNALFGRAELVGCLDADAGFVVIGHSFGGYTALMAAGATIDRDALVARCRAGSAIACGVETNLALAGAGPVFAPGDPRVRGALALAPWDATVQAEGVADIAAPVVLLTGARDRVTPRDPMVEGLYASLTARPRAVGVLADGGHYSFIYSCDALPPGDGCGPGYTPLDVAHQNAIDAALAMAARAGVWEGDAELPRDPAVSWRTDD